MNTESGGHKIVYHPGTDRIILFGGHHLGGYVGYPARRHRFL
jgi:hypothetical protein